MITNPPFSGQRAMTPKVSYSAILPAYNCSSTIARAIDSVLVQTYPLSEILVIDDGSTDDTREVVQGYGDSVRYFVLPHSGYVALVRNRGIVESRGDYLAFLDADDAWHPNKLEEVARFIGRNPEAGLFYSDFNVVDETLRFLYRARCGKLSRDPYKRLLRHTPIATSTAVVKRDCFEVCGLFLQNVAACEDWEMWIRISRKFHVVYLPLPLSEYTFHKKAPSLSNTEDWFSAQLQVLEKVFGNDPDLTEKEKRRICAWAHYRAGRLRSIRGQDQEALLSFRSSIREDFFQWRSWLFIVLLGMNSLVRPFIGWRHRRNLSVK